MKKMISLDHNFHNYIRLKCIKACIHKEYDKETRQMMHRIAMEIEKHKLHEEN